MELKKLLIPSNITNIIMPLAVGSISGKVKSSKSFYRVDDGEGGVMAVVWGG